MLTAGRRPVRCLSSDATKVLAGRVVPLCTFAREAVTAAGLPAPGWAFRRRDGQGGPNTPQRVSHLCNRHLHGCGSTATLHKLRHRFATEFYEASGHNLLALRDALGHLSIQSTTVYTLTGTAAASEAAEKIPAPPRRLRACL